MRTGWIDLGGAIYYLGEDGVMSTGLRPVGDAIYYFGTDGIRTAPSAASSLSTDS